jgi:hypothetical protein
MSQLTRQVHSNLWNQPASVAEKRGLVKGNVEFRNTRHGTRVVAKEMTDFSAIKSLFQNEKLPFFTFHP